ncbi:MAG: hypothetical protein HY460_01625, partial [Parcubacteria group bacterium]|nr:hypothetical protein [Parcubacteria group bacterium]
VKETTLFGDTGMRYAPVAWEGDPPSGHHREGVLTFNRISPLPASIALTIAGIQGAGDYIFSWKLQ